MVEHNSQLRELVRSLAEQNEEKQQELKKDFEVELKQQLDELGHKVADTMKWSEEQSDIINRLHGTVGMYRRLYEEEVNAHPGSQLMNAGPVAENTGLRQLLDGSKEVIGKMHEKAVARMQLLEAELDKARQEITNAHRDCAQADAEAASARDQVISLRTEIENQRKEMGTVLVRNMEFSLAITDYQQELQESSQKLQAAEDLGHQQNIEVDVFSHVQHVCQFQASLDTVQAVEEVREVVRVTEKKKLKDEVNKLQKGWVEAKTELEMERTCGQNLIAQRDTAVSEALKQVEVANKELSQALKAVSTAETHAQVAEIISSLQQAREELHQVREDMAAATAHADQYKSMADFSDKALKQMEAVYNNYKEEAEHRKESMETEVRVLRMHICDLETEISEKDKASGGAAEENKALTSALHQIDALKDSEAKKQVALDEAEQLNITVQQELEKLRWQWCHAQNNYERQVLLQADTIRELTVTSDKLSQLENIERALHARREKAEAELELLKVTWAVEMTSLEAAKADAEMKFKELDKQNQLLLNRLSSMHSVAADTECKAAGIPGDEAGESSEVERESDLQNVIRYLHQSKETVDMELSSLKQEKNHLQKQLEAAYHATEEAKASLRQEHESARTSIYSDEEFHAPQAQKHDQETLAELVVVKKELEVLKVTVTRMEEERGKREDQVTKLEQNLLEAMQSEAAVKVQLDCYKRLAQFQKGKLDGLGKEKEEACKEINNLTKQIEELSSSAGKRTAADQLVAAQQESLGHQEPVVYQDCEESLAQQEQTQKEIESKLREKETKIQSLERLLHKEKHGAKQWKSKRQKDLKLFYEVVQKAAVEKKRFLEELENLKHEKAYYELKAHVNGAWSLDEPPVKVTEIDERAFNYQVATNDMKKLADEFTPTCTPVTPAPTAITISDLTCSTLMPALPSDVAGASAPVAESSARPIVGAPSKTVVSVVQKRSAPRPQSSVAGDIMSQEIKTESAPLHKKSRAAEDMVMEDTVLSSLEKTISTAGEDHVVEEIAKGLEATETWTPELDFS